MDKERPRVCYPEFLLVSSFTLLILVSQPFSGTISSDGGVTNPKCGGNYSVPEAKGLSFFCRPPLYGRYVTIRSFLLNNALTVCEVEVYSEKRGMLNVYFGDGEGDCDGSDLI